MNIALKIISITHMCLGQLLTYTQSYFYFLAHYCVIKIFLSLAVNFYIEISNGNGVGQILVII
jgi:hypothetical protein